jgi:hypothetical protein
MKKILSLVLVLSLVLGSMSFAFAAPSDVVGTDYEEAVNRLVAVGIINGYEDGTFKPERTITRAEFAKIVVTALGLDAAAAYGANTSDFTDVAGHWAAGYINIAASRGIVNGMGDGTFAPDAKVTFEQAVTMLVRALGYEPSISGGYPAGYLVKAAELDITDGVKGVVGAPAPRGIVALLTDNALETPMMIQVGYGDEAKYVVSGQDGTEEQNILETKLDMLNVDEVVKNIPRTDSDLEDNQIELATTGVVEVLDGFNFEAVFGAEITAYINDDDVVVAYEVNDDVIYDSAEWDSSDEELDLYAQEEGYAINEDAVVYVDGEEAAASDLEADFDFVKVIMNDDDEITFADAFNWDDSIVVEEVDDELVVGTDENANSIELDVEDFTIIKNGKVAEVEDGDILYYNEDTEYAEIFADVVSGKLDDSDIFADEFELKGDDYTIGGTYVDADGDMAELDKDALEDMADADDNTIKVSLTRAGEIRLVEGSIEVEADDETVAGFLTEDMTVYEGTRGKLYIGITMVNENGTEVLYDVELTKDVLGLEETDTLPTEGKLVDADTVIELTIDEDGEVTGITYDLDTTDFDAADDEEMVELDDKYIASKRLSDSVVVFYVEDYTDDADDIVVVAWDKVEDFELVDEATVYYGDDDYVDYLVVKVTDAEEETTDKDVLVTEIRALSSGEEWRIKGFVDGEEITLYTDSDEFTESTTIADAVYGDLITVSVDDNTGKVVADGTEADAAVVIDGSIEAINYGDKEVTIAGETYELISDGAVYDATDSDDVEVAKLRNLHVGDTVRVYLDVEGTTFAKYIVLFTEAE